MVAININTEDFSQSQALSDEIRMDQQIALLLIIINKISVSLNDQNIELKFCCRKNFFT